MAVTTIDGKEVVLGLTEKFRFHVNDVEVCFDISSNNILNLFNY